MVDDTPPPPGPFLPRQSSDHAAVPGFVVEDLAGLGIELPDEFLGRLASYLHDLLEFNRHTNLTAVRESEQAWRRLIIDSLTALFAIEELPEGAALMDVGTGGGLPGIPLAICRPDLRVTLLDSVGKKAGFCRDVCGSLGLENAEVLHARAELLGHDAGYRQRYDAVISRAVGPMPVVLEYSLPLARVGGAVLAMKGPRLAQELAASGDAIQILGGGAIEVVDAYPPAFGNDLVIARISKERPTPRLYPRSPGVPKAQPLSG